MSEQRSNIDRTPMAMLPNDHHPGPRCSCRECQQRYPDEPESQRSHTKGASFEVIAREQCSDFLKVAREGYSPSGPIEALVILGFMRGAGWALGVETPQVPLNKSEVALNQGPRQADGVGSNPDLRAQGRQYPQSDETQSMGDPT